MAEKNLGDSGEEKGFDFLNYEVEYTSTIHLRSKRPEDPEKLAERREARLRENITFYSSFGIYIAAFLAGAGLLFWPTSSADERGIGKTLFSAAIGVAIGYIAKQAGVDFPSDNKG